MEKERSRSENDNCLHSDQNLLIYLQTLYGTVLRFDKISALRSFKKTFLGDKCEKEELCPSFNLIESFFSSEMKFNKNRSK